MAPERVTLRKKGTIDTITLSKERYDTLLAASRHLLEERSGYLHARDRFELEEFIRGQVVNGIPDVQRCEKRAAQFAEAGIGPIFLPEFERTTLIGERFPVMDYIILHGAGTFSEKMKDRAIRRIQLAYVVGDREANKIYKSSGGGLLSPPATPQDTILFAQRAFDDGAINIHFLRYHKYRLAETTAIDDSVSLYSEQFPRVLSHLRDALGQFIPEKTSYPQVFDPSDDLAFLGYAPAWVLDFSPTDRHKIAEEYTHRLSKKALPRSTKVMRRMQYLFPDTCSFSKEDLVHSHVCAAAEAALDRGSFSDVPRLAYLDPQYQKYRAKAITLVDTHLDTMLQPDPSIIMEPLFHPLASRLKIPVDTLRVEEVTDFVHKRRLEFLQGLTDPQFTQQVTSQYQVMGLAVRHTTPLPSATALRDYVLDRARRCGVMGGDGLR